MELIIVYIVIGLALFFAGKAIYKSLSSFSKKGCDKGSVCDGCCSKDCGKKDDKV